MAFQFPPTPTVGQTFTPVAGTTYRWSGTAWHLIAGPGSFITQADADTRYVNVDEAQNTTNRIINGKMAIDQRNAGGLLVVAPGSSGMGADRWNILSNGTGSLQTVVAVEFPRPGEKALILQTVTVDATVAAGEFYGVSQSIEGLNLADMNFGAAGASSFTLAFEVQSSIAGTFAVGFRNGTGTRSYVTTFTLPTANVFATVGITVPGDTTGTWASDNSAGMSVLLSLGAGATFHAPAANTWTAGNFFSVAGCTNLISTASAFMRLANIRLYKGSVDFGPDRRLYAEELALCQRYYCKSYSQATIPGTAVTNGIRGTVTLGTGIGVTNVTLQFPVAMRAAPTVTLYSFTTGAVGVWPINSVDTAVATAHISDNSGIVSNNAVTTAAQFMGGHFTASAEL